MPQLLARVLAFILIPVVYWLFGWLNLVQVAKSALLGSLALLALSAWTQRGREGRVGTLLNIGMVFLFTLIIAYQGFLRSVYGVAQDDALVMEALFNTNRSESLEFILQNGQDFLIHLLVLAIVTFLFSRFILWQSRRPVRTSIFSALSRNRSLKFAVLFTLLFAAIHLNPTMRKENPLLYFPLRYAKWKKSVDHAKAVQERLASSFAADRTLAAMRYGGEGGRTVVFVLGESTTRLNWSLYGYPRSTTPELQAMQDRLVRFNDVVTTNGSTVLDMEQILTPATRQAPKLFEERPDILTIARKAGYKTFWITNHSTDMTGVISIFATGADKTINANHGGSRGEGSYDEVVLPHLREALADPAPLKLIIVHILGAHPAYYFRYPEDFARFNAADDAVSQELDRAGRAVWAKKMRNYYDNAILYGDHVLRQSIKLCEERTGAAIAWLYVPDHGEDVAHYTNFVGHNTRVAAMFEIPMLFWRSPAFSQGDVDEHSLVDRPYQTDQLDHTLLGLMQINGDYYDPHRDILSPQFQPLPRVVAGVDYPDQAPKQISHTAPSAQAPL